MGCLVGDAPDDDVCTVLVAQNHIRHLLLGIGVSLWIGPRNGPVARYLAPYEDAHALSLTNHILVVWIVCQTYEVTTQLLGPRQQGVGVAHAVGTTTTVRLLLVHANAFQEDRLAIEQQLFATRLDGAEADGVHQRLTIHADLHAVALGTVGRPALRLGLHSETGSTVGCGGNRLFDFQFRDNQRNLTIGLLLVQLHGEEQLTGVALIQQQTVVLDIGRCHLDEQDVAGDAAIVPPVENLGGHILCTSLVVCLHNDDILTLLQQVSHIHVERCETTDMMASELAVDIDVGVVVDGTKIEQILAW